MKTIFGLFLVGLVASVSATIAPIKLGPGQSYIYAYSGKLISGIAEFDSSAALMEMKCDIVMQEEQDSHIAMQMMNIRVGKQNGPKGPQGFGNVVLDHQSEPQYEEELSKPIRFYWADNGQIKNFEADRNESEWSVNIKKSILSLLNINLAPQMTMDDDFVHVSDQQKEKGLSGSSDQQKMVVYPVYEDGINGICETLYQVISAADYRLIPGQTDNVQVFNMTKTRNYGNCLRQSGKDRQSTSDIRGAPVVCAQGQSYPLVSGFNSLFGQNYELGGCQHYQSTETPNVGLYSFVKYNMTVLPADNSSRIDSIYGQGKTVHQTKGKQLVLVAEQNITLVEVIPTAKIGPIQQIRNIMLYEDLSYRLPENKDQLEIPFYQLYGQIDRQELQELIPALLDSVAKDIEANQVETSENTMQKVVQLINAIAVLDVQQLQNVFEQVAGQQGAHQRMIRQLFLDVLSYAGTSDSVFFAKQLYEQDQISAFEAKQVLETIPANLYRIDGKVVQAYLDLFLGDKVQDEQNLASSVGIAFGKLIREAILKREQSTKTMREDDKSFMNGIHRTTPWYDDWTMKMDEGQIPQVLRLLREALKSCNTFQQKVTLIETLAHAGTSQALALLAPYVRNEVSYEELPGYPVDDEQNVDQERNFIRQVTIYALTHISSLNESNHAEVLSLLMPIFQNKFEPYEVRIAAFTVMLTCQPDRVILEQICSEMHRESNRQVRSFVVSALQTVAKFSDPNTRKLADDARFALAFAPQDQLGMQYSKMIGQSYYDDGKQYGMNVMVEWVASNVSQIPRSGYVAVRESDGDLQQVLLEVGYNAKGIDSIIKRLARSDTLINLVNGEGAKTLKREAEKALNQKEKSVRLIQEKLPFNVRNEEELKATVFMKIFEQTSYYSFDRQSVEQLIDSAEGSIKQITNQLKQGQDYHFVRLLMLKQMQKVVYAEMGFPVMVTERNPTIVSVKVNQARLQMNASGKSVWPESANFSFQVEPSIYHTNYDFVFGILPISIEAIGTYVERSSRVSVPVAISAGFRRVWQQFDWSVTPQVSQEIMHHQTEAATFIARAKIAGSPDHQWISDAQPIRTQNSPYRYEREYFKKELGIGMRLQVSTENVLGSRQPWYQSRTAQKHGMLAAFLELVNNHQMTPCTVHLMLESDEQNPVSGYEMSVRYKKVHINDNEGDDGEAGDDSAADDDDGGDQYGVDMRKHLGSRQSSSVIEKMVHDLVAEWNQESSETQIDDKADLVAHSLQLIVESQSIQPTIYTGQVLVAHSYDQKVYYAKVQGASQDSGRSVNGQLCVNSIMVYPNAPSDFYYEAIALQDLKAMIRSRIDFGQDCQSGSHLAVKALMKTGEKQQQAPFYGDESNDSHKLWFYQQCDSDRENGQPASYACQRALIEDSYFKQLAMEVTYQNLDDQFSNLTYRAASAAKAAFYHNVDENQLVQNERNKVAIDGYYLSRFENYPMVDVYVRAPAQNVWFEQVVAPYFRPMSAYLSPVKVYENLLKGYQPDEQCTMMEGGYVRTFDNVSIALPDSGCQYLLAKDCSESEIFTIYVRQLDAQSKSKEATVIVQGKEIVLSPPSSQSSAQIQIDGKKLELQASKAEIMFGGQMSVYLRETSSPSTFPIVVVEHEQHQLQVLYDGKNIQVRLGSQYKGETCGICGDDNHESDGEFVGPDLCEYERAEDFINSYALVGSPECAQVPEAQGAKYCGERQNQRKHYAVKENGPLSKLKDEWVMRKKSNSIKQMNDHRSWSEGVFRRGLHQHTTTDGSSYHRMVYAGVAGAAGAAQNNQMQRMRTLAIRRNDRLCFSVQPILTCIEGVSRPYQVQQQTLGFHCLPAQSISAQKLAEQSQYQVLEIFGKKQIDFAAPIQVPVSCQTV